MTELPRIDLPRIDLPRIDRTVPLLPCRDLDDVAPFYAALGFVETYRQVRPNPYLCLRRGAIDLHFFAVEGFDPAESMGSVLLLVPDTGALHDAFAAGLRDRLGRVPLAGIPRLHDAFAAGLRDRLGRVPLAGIPRMTRPRRRQGTTAGFTVVDPGGNWLRISRSGDSEEDDGAATGRLDRVLRNAARQGDARGDEVRALAVLDAGLSRHPDASDAERLPLLAYRAELLVRTGDGAGATAAFAAVRALDLDDAARVRHADDLAAVAALERDRHDPSTTTGDDRR